MSIVRLRNGDLFNATIEHDSSDKGAIEGYIRDQKDRRIYHSLHPPCKYRSETKCPACGGKARIDYHCSIKKQLNFLDCVRCDLQADP